MSSIVIEFDDEMKMETIEKILNYIGDAINREVTAGGIPGSRYGDRGYCSWQFLE
jgi:hypothetical protein